MSGNARAPAFAAGLGKGASYAAITRMQALMPRRVAEAIIRFTKGDQLLLAADPAARAAYEARITGSGAAAEQERTAA